MARPSSIRVPGSSSAKDPPAPVETKADAAKRKHGNAFNEGKLTYSSANIRFTTKGAALYAIVLGWPDGPVTIKSLAKNSPVAKGEITHVRLPGQYGEDCVRADGCRIDRHVPENEAV